MRSPAFPARRPDLDAEHAGLPFRRSLRRARAALSKRISAAPFEADEPRLSLLAAAMSALLEVSGLRKRFPVGRGAMLHAVDDVDFDLAEGESLGIIGESGSGKSTIARLIARLADPTAGRIRFEGRDIGAIPARKFAGDAARKSIQLVFQSAGDSLNPAYSAARNIAVGLGSTRLDREAREWRVDAGGRSRPRSGIAGSPSASIVGRPAGARRDRARAGVASLAC